MRAFCHDADLHTCHGQTGCVNVVVWSDYLCPWCYVHVPRVRHLESAHGAEVTWLPYELHPHIREGGLRLEVAYGKGDADAAAKVLAQFEAIAADNGQPFSPPSRVRPTRRAHTLAIMVGGQQPGRFERLHDRLFEAIWVNDEPVDEIDWLVERGTEAGLDGGEVASVVGSDGLATVLAASRDKAHEMGVTGTPATMFEGGFVLPGLQDHEVIDRIGAKLAQRSAER